MIDTVPAEKLLVFQVSQGWEPLCQFLDLPIPDEPFPRANTRAQFVDLMQRRMAGEGKA